MANDDAKAGNKRVHKQAAEEDKTKQEGTNGAHEENQQEEEQQKAANGKENKGEEPEPKRQATEERKAEGNLPKDILEEGRIYFIYRPKVSVETPQGVDDVQRFFLLLSPTSRKGAPAKLLAIGKKRLPKAAGHERFFGFVADVEDSAEKIIQGMGAEKYETKTRGTREKPGARIAGEGVYSIVSKGQRNTHFVYELELPEDPGELQKDLEVEKAASYTFSIKNPDMANPVNAGLNDKADFVNDEKKMEQFGNYRWIGAHDPSLLDYERCEFLLVGAGKDVKGHVSDEAATHMDRVTHDDVVKALHAAGKDDQVGDEEAEEAALMEAMRKELHPEKAGVPMKPAKEGEWA